MPRRAQTPAPPTPNFFRWLLDQQPAAMLVVAADGLVRYANPACEGLLGASAAALIGSYFGVPLGGADGLTVQLPQRSGGLGQAEWQVLPLEWEGQPAYGLSLRDLTHQPPTEHGPRETEDLHRLALSSLSDAVFITDDAGQFKYISANVEVAFGYSVAEVAALGNAQALLGGALVDPAAVATVGEISNLEWAVTDKGGQRRELLINVKRVALAGGTQLYSCRDVTERSRVAQAARLSGARFQALIENNADIVALFDARGRFIFASAAVQTVLGHSPQTLVGRPGTSLVHPADRHTLLQAMQRVSAAAGQRATHSFRMRHADGRWRWMEGTGQNLLGEPGVLSIVANFRDVSERHRAQARLAAFAQLGQRLAAVRTAVEAARLIFEVADDLLGWDSCYLDRYVPAEDRQYSVLHADIIDGQRVIETDLTASSEPSRDLMAEGGKLVLRQPEEGAFDEDLRPFGNTGRRSASLMFVPIHYGAQVRGILSIQSYSFDAYTPDDLQALQALADHCGGALDRLQIEEDLREREALLSQMLELLPVGVWLADAAGRIQSGNAAGLQIWGRARYGGPEALEEYRGWWSSTGERLSADAWGVSRAIQHGETSINEVIDIETFTGQRKTILNSVVPLRDGDQAITGAIIVNEDITERRQRERELEALANLSAALRQAATRAEMLPVILNHLIELVHAEGAALVRPVQDTEVNLLEVELAIGGWANTTGLRVPLAGSPSERVMASGTPLVSTDARAEPGYATPQLLDGVLAAACLPLVADEHAIGAVWVLRARPYGPAEVRLLVALADMAANALRRASLHEQTQRRAEQLAAMNALGRALSETLNLPQIYEQLYTATLQLLPDLATLIIGRYAPESDHLTAVFAVHAGARLDSAQLPPLNLAAPTGDRRAPLILNHLTAEAQPLPAALLASGSAGPAQSALYVPMLTKGRVIGVMHVQSYARDRFSPAEAELLSLAANTAAIAIENARLFSETERRLHYMQALHDIDRAITSSLDLRVTLDVLLDQAVAQLDVDAAAVLLLNPHLQTLEYAAGRGFRSKSIERTHLRLDEDQASRAATERQPIFLPNLAEFSGDFTRRRLLLGERFVSYYAMPLIAKGEVKGVLEVFHRSLLEPTVEWRDFLQTLAGQAAMAIDNTALFNSLQRSNTELSLAYDATIEGWSRALDLRDRETEGHTQRVASLTMRLARAIGLSDAELTHVRRGALLHDIGKMGIPDGILHKPGPLSDEEWVIMRRHPVYAYELLRPVEFLRPALDIPYCHHEKWDGSGYPRGLHGEQIPLAARVFAVVDVWDALSSDRPYRAAWPAERVRAYLRDEVGRHFDPRVVETFLSLEAGGRQAGPWPNEA